ncbi:TATA box-binding protein-associated factor RNA polymerase I subunit C [Genypterus blacodes]|uniref:TATA box-binding protein-associated factor RNA polymerase I subunit C n=1 Tax=Genypterus blacodes TaxID=154954 RepID=UPI003F759037
MDFQFPRQLFPSFYNSGPPDLVPNLCAGNWGTYDRITAEGGSGPLSSWTFTPRHDTRGETWIQTQTVTRPLLSPKHGFLFQASPPDPLDFTDHMQNFFMNHCQDAFSSMSEHLGGNFNFTPGEQEGHRKDSVHMWRVKRFLDKLKYKICHQSYSCRAMELYNALLPDVIHDIPPELLGSLLYEELAQQRARMLFSEAATGGALAFVPFNQSCDSQHGCLVYPEQTGLDRLNFLKVALQYRRGGPSRVDACSSKPFSFQLKGPVKQISSACLLDDCCVAVRSDHLCAAWRFSERSQPTLLQVINTTELATCINVSPHVLGEVLVASESGAANLWTVGKCVQKVRKEDSNLYFNDKSAWRWCEFSAHPRVMLYADRTGVELTDIRVAPVSGLTLFRIGKTSECRSGERLILSRYLGDSHCFHHLITTQYSAYIMDERFPCVPMLKWDHMMRSPPMFCQVLPGSASPGSGAGETRTTKVVLGSQFAQEITLLQYSGGRAEPCVTCGPPQALLRPSDSLNHLPVQIPHRLDMAHSRLASPAAGLTCIQKRQRGEECICVLQLTEAGDVFYQILEPQQTETTRPPVQQEESAPQQGVGTRIETAPSEATASGTGSKPQLPRQETDNVAGMSREALSESSSEESDESGRKKRRLKHLGLQVIVNDVPVPGKTSELVGGSDVNAVNENNNDVTKEPCVEETTNGSVTLSSAHASEPQSEVKLGTDTLNTWKVWLQKLIPKSRKNEARPQRLQRFTTKTKDLLCPPEREIANPTDEELVCRLRQDLRACMTNRSLLLQGTVSSLELLETVPLPDTVNGEQWKDPLSQRLNASWRGKDSWTAWWEDWLGLNREAKVKELRRKRRREKATKRDGGQSLDLSGSFTSSLSHQDLDDFSDWTSSASQGAWSDSEGNGNGTCEGNVTCQLDGLLEGQTPRAETPNATPITTTSATLLQEKEQHGEQTQSSLSSSLLPPVSPTPKPSSVSQRSRRSRHPLGYLSNLLAQEQFSQPDSYFLEEENDVHPPRPLSVTSSQRQASQSTSQRSIRADLSQDTSVRSGLSQSQSLSQLSQPSQGRAGPPQTPQPKKKSRMGF